MDFLYVIPSILIVTYLFTKVGTRLRIPNVVSLILAGVFLGMPIFQELMTDHTLHAISDLGDFGILVLMFLAGLETSTGFLLKELRIAAQLSVVGSVVPFIMGFLVFYLMGFPLAEAMIIGVCMSITAEGTTAELLLDLGKIKTKVGTLLMESGLLDDVLGIGAFILITFFMNGSYAQENMLLVGAVFAYFVGLMVQHILGRHIREVKTTEKVLYAAVVPFFFVSMGLSFDLSQLALNPMLAVLVLIVAFGGKMLASFIVKPLDSLSWKQHFLVGWAMNSRGAIELALALIAYRSATIPVEVYSSLVVMALVTTLAFPLVVTRMLKKNPRLMN